MKTLHLKLILIALIVVGGFYYLAGPMQYGIVIPKIKALYEDSLQSKITSSATSMTLIRGTDKQDRDLSGTYGFVIDEGNTIEEFVICDASGTALTNCLRGIDVEDGETEVADSQEEHRRGASVKISNFPQLAIISRVINGDENFPNLLVYENAQLGRDANATSSAIMAKAYMDSLAIAGSPTSTYSQIGMTMLGDYNDTASGTPSSTPTGAPLVVPTALTTSTPSAIMQTGDHNHYIPVSEDDGKLNQLWLDLTELFDFTTIQSVRSTTTDTIYLAPNTWFDVAGTPTTTPIDNLAGGLGTDASYLHIHKPRTEIIPCVSTSTIATGYTYINYPGSNGIFYGATLLDEGEQYCFGNFFIPTSTSIVGVDVLWSTGDTTCNAQLAIGFEGRQVGEAIGTMDGNGLVVFPAPAGANALNIAHATTTQYDSLTNGDYVGIKVRRQAGADATDTCDSNNVTVHGIRLLWDD